jgi:hypothetical protein
MLLPNDNMPNFGINVVYTTVICSGIYQAGEVACGVGSFDSKPLAVKGATGALG